MVLLHALGASKTQWLYLLPVLSQHYRVWCPDLRDHGDSDLATEPYHMAAMVNDVLRLMDRCGLVDPHLVGHDLGGLVALSLAIAVPDRVRSLTLINTAAHARPLDLRSLGLSMFYRLVMPNLSLDRVRDHLTRRLFPEPDQQDQRLRLHEEWERNEPEGFKRALRAMLEHDVQSQLGRVTCPTLILRGALDDIVTAPYARQLVKGIPNARYQEIAGSRHFTPLDAPDDLNAAVMAFVEEVDARGGVMNLSSTG
ncbi:MAG: alpha/beta hydrolase [Alphaproteobacteria bacterium]|nr:alpha/beta hydrolase [Alphaproteobacteria bacterium]